MSNGKLCEEKSRKLRTHLNARNTRTIAVNPNVKKLMKSKSDNAFLWFIGNSYLKQLGKRWQNVRPAIEEGEFCAFNLEMVLPDSKQLET